MTGVFKPECGVAFASGYDPLPRTPTPWTAPAQQAALPFLTRYRLSSGDASSQQAAQSLCQKALTVFF